jgi:DNA-binding transcriptional LysR family regulator
VAIGELQAEPWVLSPENYELREAALVACERAGFTPRVVLDGGETDTLLRFVAAGVGIALVPRLAVQGAADLVSLHVSDQKLQRSLGVVWRGDRVASPAARALREFLVEQLRRA